MTNANVATTVSGNDGQDLLVKYKDGEKKVIVPPGTPIAKYVPGSADDLKLGAKFFVWRREKQAGRHAARAERSPSAATSIRRNERRLEQLSCNQRAAGFRRRASVQGGWT